MTGQKCQEVLLDGKELRTLKDPSSHCLQIKDCVYFILKVFERYDTSSDSSCAVGLVKALDAKQLGFSVDDSIP